MIKVVLVGALGRMGKEFFVQSENFDDVKIVAGIDLKPCDSCYPFPIYNSLSDCNKWADVVVDFSSSASLSSVTEYCKDTQTKLAVFSTGHGDEDTEKIKNLSSVVAVFSAPNTSLGSFLQKKAVEELTKKLPHSEIEIIESHNTLKKDIPSGTALDIAESICRVDNSRHIVVSRQYPKQDKKEVGINSVRYGNNVCEHEVIFSFGGETLKICHSVTGRNVFATNALNAVRFLADKKSGFYTISHLLGDKYDK